MRCRTWLELSMAALVVWTAAASVARAEAVPHEQMVAEARWYVHVDLDAMRNSTLGRNIIEHQAGEKHAGRLAWIERHTGMRPHEDLSSILIFGTDYQERQGMAILHGTFDRDRVVDRLSGVRGYQLLDETNDVHRLALPNDARRDLYVTFARQGMVLASDRDRLDAALATLAGEAPHLPADSVLIGPAREGTMIQFGAIDLSQMPERHANVMQAAERIRLSLGEHDEQVQLHASVVAGDEQTAQQLYDAMRGMKAFAMLRHDALTSIFEQIRIHRADEQIEVDWSIAARHVINLLERHVR